jgi:hypothetical protein
MHRCELLLQIEGEGEGRHSLCFGGERSDPTRKVMIRTVCTQNTIQSNMFTGQGGAHQWDEVAAFLVGSMEGAGEGGAGDLEDGQNSCGTWPTNAPFNFRRKVKWAIFRNQRRAGRFIVCRPRRGRCQCVGLWYAASNHSEHNSICYYLRRTQFVIDKRRSR